MRAADGLWAIGDVTGIGAFTHLAVYQAWIAASDILGIPGFTADYTALPRVTFTDPEVGSVGLSQAAAQAAGLKVRAGSAPVSASSRGAIHAYSRGACSAAGQHIASDDLCLPDIPPRGAQRPCGPLCLIRPDTATVPVPDTAPAPAPNQVTWRRCLGYQIWVTRF
jgi:hypothetical protein